MTPTPQQLKNRIKWVEAVGFEVVSISADVVNLLSSMFHNEPFYEKGPLFTIGNFFVPELPPDEIFNVLYR